MTWQELADEILEMTAEQRDKEVMFVEPHQDDPEIYLVDVCEAEEDLFSCKSGDPSIVKGEFYLQ